MVATTDYYLNRGLRQIGTALPVELVVEFDRRVAEIPFRSKNSMIAEALRHSWNALTPTGAVPGAAAELSEVESR